MGVLKTNLTAGFSGLFRATGTSPAPCIAELATQRAGGTVKERKVATPSGRLDDSMRGCAPRKRQKQTTERSVTGYTEEVIVSRTGGNTGVLAKSDTGATRTSMDAQLAAEIGTGPI